MADGASFQRIPTDTAGPAGAPPRRRGSRPSANCGKPAPEGEAPAAPKAPAPPKNASREPAPRPRAAEAQPDAPAACLRFCRCALVAGGYFYVTGGQVMSTDNAYVQADTVGVSTDVAGTVVGDRSARQ